MTAITEHKRSNILFQALSVMLLITSAATLYMVFLQLPYFGDWDSVYYPVLFLENPYDHIGFLNPPWVLFVLYPFKIFSGHVAGALWMIISVISVIYCSKRLGADWLSYVLIFTNPAFIRFLTSGQIDILVLWGFVLSQSPWNILLLTVKPQVLGTSILFKLKEFKREHLGIILVVLGITIVVFGNWFVDIFNNWQTGVNHSVSMDIFPFGIPIGLALLYWAYKNRNEVMGALSSFFLVPYISPSSTFVYSILVFSTFKTVNRVVVYLLLWTVALVLT